VAAAASAEAPSPSPLGHVFWWLFVGSLLSALATFVGPFLALYLTAQGFRPAAVGLTASCYGLGALFAGPLAGSLSDTLGRRRTLLGALFVAAASAAALAFVRLPLLVALAVLVFGASSSSCRPPMRATVADVVAPTEVPRAFGWLYWAENAGATVSLAVGGLLALRGFTLPFLCDAATTLVYAGVVLLRIPETRPKGAAGDSGGGGYRVVLLDRPLLGLLFAIVLTHLVYSQCFVALPIHMARLGFSPAAYGAVSAVSAGLVVVLQPFSARLLAWASPGRTLALGAALIALGNGANALCTTRLEFMLAFSTWTLGEIAFFATASSTVARLAPEAARGHYMAAYGLCLSGAMVLSSAAGPALLAFLGPGLFWGGCLLVAGVAAAAFLVWERLLAPASAVLGETETAP
jgi:MFS family permease